MSTRGACGVKIGGKYKVTYNHSDSYPEGMGKEVVDFCQKVQESNHWENFRKVCKKLELVDSNSKPSPVLQKKYHKYADFSVGNQKADDWYCLLRGLQGIKNLSEMLYGDIVFIDHMIDSFDFLKDSLFCEYAYIINLDDMTLEFYQGYNHSPQADNPLPFEQVALSKDYEGEDNYYPVRYMGSFPLDNIPEDWMEKIFVEEKEEVEEKD